MKKILILIIPVILLSACKNNDVFIVNGSVKNSPRKNIIISKVDINTTVPIDSSKISKNGNFKFRVKAIEPDFYEVGFSSSNFITLLAEPGERISLTFEDNNLYENYTVEGSKGSELLQMLDFKLLDTRKKLDSLNAVYEKASKEPGFETVKPQLEKEIVDIIKAQRRFNIEFVITNINSLASIKAIYQKLNEQTYVLYEPRDLQYLKIVSDSLKIHYPDSRHTKALVSTFEQEMDQYNTRKLNMMIDTLPEVKLDPVLKDISGRRVALSSLRGKHVLLSFWSADSRECITENLQLKEFYRLYRKKGFEIYQISLDKDESAWKAAVKFDELPWISTREDNPDNPKNAFLFNVRSIPANFLFDPQGKIIASNLHGKSLQLKLNQLFNN
jgi:hypothetical protein